MDIPFSKNKLALSLGFLSGVLLMPAHAEQVDRQKERSVSLEEVIVTAQKREQNMQDTPIAMTSFSVGAMEKQGISDISDAAQYMPNVVISESPGGSTGATASIRGAVTGNPAITWEPTVGIYVDGVFVAKNVGGLFDVAEMERLEVLRGPQGTLYGKNTLGGAINLITRKPGEEFSGTARLKVGNYNYTEEFLSVDTGKFGDVASFNIAVNKKDRDGFYKNTFQGPGVAKRHKELDSTSARFAALFDVSDDVELYYTYDMSKKDNTPPFGQFDLAGSKADQRRGQGGLDGARYDKSKGSGHAFHVAWDATAELTFKSITAYRSVKFDDAGDYDGHTQYPNIMLGDPPSYVIGGVGYYVSEFNGQRHTETKQISQEFQLIGSFASVDFVIGAFYFNEDSDAYNPFDLGVNGFVDNKYGVNSESYALFGQADWSVTDELILTAGLRWTHEKKAAYLERIDGTFTNAFGGDVQPRVKADDSWQNVSPMVAISYFWMDNLNTYFKVSQGWKAGSFNGEAGPDSDPINPRTTAEVFRQSYDPEKVTSYEIGMKARWFDNRVQTNMAYFYNDSKDIQLSQFLVGAQTEVINAGKAHVQGLELDVIAQISRGLTVNASYGYTDAKYKKHDPSKTYTPSPTGKTSPLFPYTPRSTASLGLDYTAQLSAGEFRARLDYNWVSDYDIYDVPDTSYVTHIKSHGILNGRIALAEITIAGKQSLEVGLWGKNLTDANYRINGIPVKGLNSSNFQQDTIGAINFYGDPRTFGADVTYRW